ncbi:MAG: deoxyguanosinetriphosphate triphosphohydrolase [Syntrophomonadaceae bacterium]
MIRQEIEQREKSWMGPHAMLAVNSRGRLRSEPPDPVRTCFMVDRDRVVHSKSFRRLKHKTQVFIAPRGDHYRSRLTHTLEVNQIAKTIGSGLNLNIDLIEAMALAHDVGHTPFAHAGEQILNSLLPGGFRHNENSIRVLTRVEQHSRGPGLNLSREVLDGVLHHSGYGGQENLANSAEGRVIRLSDKIAYVQHDIDDSIRGGLLTLQDLPREHIDVLGSSHSQRIATLVVDTINYSRQHMKPGEIPIIEPSPPVENALRGLRQFMFEVIYNGPVCQAERKRAAFVVEHLYGYFMKYPDQMTPLYIEIAEQEGLERAVADYIAGMSDEYCISIFENIYVPKSLVPDQGKIFPGHDK